MDAGTREAGSTFDRLTNSATYAGIPVYKIVVEDIFIAPKLSVTTRGLSKFFSRRACRKLSNSPGACKGIGKPFQRKSCHRFEIDKSLDFCMGSQLFRRKSFPLSWKSAVFKLQIVYTGEPWGKGALSRSIKLPSPRKSTDSSRPSAAVVVSVRSNW
jgi:hypothetical protein